MTDADPKFEIAPQLAETTNIPQDTDHWNSSAVFDGQSYPDFGFPIAAGSRALVPGKRASSVAAANKPVADEAAVGSEKSTKFANAAAVGETVDPVANSASGTNSPIVIANGAAAEIDGPSKQSVTFTGAAGTLLLKDAPAFAGEINGLQGSDAIDFADISFGAETTATFLGNAAGGVLTVTDGTKTAKITVKGDYLSSTWNLSGDGAGGVTVVDPTVSTNWQTLKVGAGGFVRGLDVAANGVTVARTDTSGAYLWDAATSSWTQLVTASSMPAGYDFSAMGSGNQGVQEIQIAPSNTNIFYMQFDGDIFKSVNQGTTWTFQTSLVASTDDNPNDTYGQDGQKLAIDPNNANIVYVGTETAGLFVTTNGGSTWTNVSAVPVGSDSGITGILFDPAIGGTVGGVTQTIFAASNGKGVYESLNGGATWTHLAGGPADVQYAAVSSTGVYYAIGSDSTGNDNNALWSYANGVWKNLWDAQGTSSQQSLQGIAVDPSNPNELALVNAGGYLYVSYNAGTTWTEQFHTDAVSNDIPWETSANTNPNDGYPYAFLDVGGVAFNPLVPNQLVVSAGTGVWTTTVPASTAVQGSDLNFYDESTGIENLVAQQILVAPGGNPVLVSWDRPFFSVSYAQLDSGAYPTTYGPVSSDNIVKGSSADYASSTPSFLVGIADNWGTEESGYSTNGGQTWTPFASDIPGASSSFIGGTIAASTTQNFIWAPAGGHQPYYTLNGGKTWTAISLPGVTSWSTFDWSPYLNQESVTADRVLSNTFYLYYAGDGVFKTTNGGQSWTNVDPGYIDPNPSFAGFNSQITAVPGQAGNLFYTGGPQGSVSATPVAEPFYQSTNGGATWTAIANVQDVFCFGFGAAAAGQSYPAIYIVGYVNNVYGVWQSINNCASWTQLGTFPTSELDQIESISGDPNAFGQVYVGFSGSGYAYLAATPQFTGVTESPASGNLTVGGTVTLTLTANEKLIVAGGAPTLTLNDGGVATYTGGSGTNALTFAYTVAAGQSTTSLAATAINLPTGVTVVDGAGNAASLSLTGLAQAGPQIGGGVVTPAITAVSESPASGDLTVGGTVTLTLTANETLTVAGGAPTLTLNDGGVATYTGGSGTNALNFAYTVAAGQNTASLAATAVNLPTGVTVKDGSGNTASLSLTGLGQAGPQIDTVTPMFTAVTESPASGDLTIGATVTLTLTANENLIVAGGAPTLTLNDGGMATYTGGSGTNVLTFAYTVAAGQSATSLAATAINLPTGVTVKNGAGNAASLSLTGLAQAGPQIGGGVVTPAITAVSESPASGDLTVGATVTLTLTANENLIVAGGAPTLTLNDGGVATYTGGSGTNALTFGYTVAAGQNTASLAATAINLPTGVTVKDGSGNAASLSLTGLGQAGPQIDTVTPMFTAVTESPASGDLTIGATVTLTLTANENLIVAGGAPTLTLNDGGMATYTGGSGTNVLTFAYTVAGGQNTASLAATAVNLPTGVTIKDGAGNAASLSLTGLVEDAPQIDTVSPAFTALTESPASGDLTVGAKVTLTLTANENLIVAGGAPTLTLNDGGVATYTGGSGTNVLTFAYTVAAGQNTASLAATAINLPTGVTVKDGSGNAASLSLTGLGQVGPQIDTVTPIFTAVTESPASGDLTVGATVTLTLTANENVIVAGGAPTLTLNDGGVATYTGGSGTKVLTFAYTVAAGQNTASLAATAINLPTGVTVKDGSGNAASLSLTGLGQTGPQIGAVVTPAFTAVTESPSWGHFIADETAHLTLTANEKLFIAGGAPTLTLNDGGVATYTGGSGTNTLSFSYSTLPGQNTPSLAITAVNLPTGVTIKDAAGNTANLSLAGLAQAGVQVDTVITAFTAVTESPASGDLTVGGTVTFSLTGNKNLVVNGGTPTLTLNDGGVATYTGGSGTNALTFAYTVAAGQNTASLAATAVNLPTGVTITDVWGDPAVVSLTGLSQAGPQIGAIALAAAVAAPVITSATFSAANATWSGEAVANSTVTVYDGAAKLGVTTANSSGAWSYADTGVAWAGATFTATATVTGDVSAASAPVAATISSVTGQPYTSFTDKYATNGQPTGANFSNGMVEVWTCEPDKSYDTVWTGVTGQSYKSYEDIYNTAGNLVADAQALTTGAGNLILSGNGLTISGFSGSASVTKGADTFTMSPGTSETVTATGMNSETFDFNSTIGSVTINGFLATGTTHDVLEFHASSFGANLSANGPSQDLAALLQDTTQNSAGSSIITDHNTGDILTLVGISKSTLSAAANAGDFKFI